MLSTSVETPTNIIFLIGDGMGTSQVSAAYFYGERQSAQFSRFPILGLINDLRISRITDSGAGATAFSIGQKSYNGAIGVDMQAKPYKQLRALEGRGWQTESFPLQASPMQPRLPFMRMSPKEVSNMTLQQAWSTATSPFAVGGQKWFCEPADSLNYLDSLKHYGFSVGMNLGGADHSKRVGYLLATTVFSNMRDDDFLPNATTEALEYFAQSDKPFFLWSRMPRLIGEAMKQWRLCDSRSARFR